MPSRVDWTNEAQWRGALDDALRKIHVDSAEGMERLGVMIENAAKRYAPVDTGRLRSSITHTTEDTAGVISCTISAPVHYAPHQEYGTRFMAAHPFLRPGMAEGANRYLQAMSAVGK